jgi:hypothetical protein
MCGLPGHTYDEPGFVLWKTGCDTEVDPKEKQLPYESILNRDLLAQLNLSFVEGATLFFTLNRSKYAELFSFCG